MIAESAVQLAINMARKMARRYGQLHIQEEMESAALEALVIADQKRKEEYTEEQQLGWLKKMIRWAVLDEMEAAHVMRVPRGTRRHTRRDGSRELGVTCAPLIEAAGIGRRDEPAWVMADLLKTMRLTPLEMKVLDGRLDGRTLGSIAGELGYSTTYVWKIMRGVQAKAQVLR